MICFKDRTFCSSKNCQNLCGRQMTHDLKQQAIKAELPICYQPFCDEKKDLINATVKQQTD